MQFFNRTKTYFVVICFLMTTPAIPVATQEIHQEKLVPVTVENPLLCPVRVEVTQRGTVLKTLHVEPLTTGSTKVRVLEEGQPLYFRVHVTGCGVSDYTTGPWDPTYQGAWRLVLSEHSPLTSFALR